MRHDRPVLPPRDHQRQWLKVFESLGEGASRLLAGQRALELGKGGVATIAKLTGLSRTTVLKGVADLRDPKALKRLRAGRSRRCGGGRKLAEAVDPELKRALTALLEESTAGDPMAVLRWTCKSTRTLARELSQGGHRVGHTTVARLLDEMDYSLQLNQKSLEGEGHVGRDEQFEHIHATVKEFMATGDPVLSVDAKKRELVGRFKNGGRSLRPRGKPHKVNVYDYRDLAEGVAIPYGTYDIRANQGLVNVGTTYDTSEFAVESIRRWWKLLGRSAYPDAKRLLICADGGGSNGSRRRTWKFHLQVFATELGIPIAVCHYPPGTSKWNKIEHRLFSFISINWQGKPLCDYETVINLIGGTRTRTGLQVKAILDKTSYSKGQEVTNEQMAAIHLTPGPVSPTWNYMISPAPKT